MKYLLLFCANPQDAEVWEALPEETRAQQDTRVGQRFAQHRSQIRSGHQLHAPYTATSVHFTPNGQPLITDGPFSEGTEVLGGYAEIEVADLDEALQLAKTWPARSVVEIRPLVEQEWTRVDEKSSTLPTVTSDEIHATLNTVFREEAGRLGWALLRILGDFEVAGEIVQDALLVALQRWPVEGIPAQPGTWLMTVARRRARARAANRKPMFQLV